MWFEQVMTHQPSEANRQLAGVRAEDFGDRHPGVVITDASGREAEEAKGGRMSLTERFCAFAREGHHEHRIAMDHAHYEESDLRQLSANAGQRVAEVHLGFARRLNQRHEDLPGRPGPHLANSVLDYSVAAVKSFRLQRLPNLFCCVTLLLMNFFVCLDDSFYAVKVWANLGFFEGFSAMIARRLAVVPDFA